MKNVLVLMSVDQKHKEKLERAGTNCNFVYGDPDSVSTAAVQEANIIIGLPKAEMIQASENLELLQLESAGTDPYIQPGVLSNKTILTNSTGAYSQAVAEHAFALTLMLIKKLHLYRDDQNRACWSDRGVVGSLNGSTVAVVGLGDIGQYYAKLVKAMGAHVIGVKRRMSSLPEFVDELVMTQDLEQVLPRADVILSILPGTVATKYIYSAESFDQMKDSAIFINCGRGNAVASDVLYQALAEKKISAAGIDVAEIEPLPSDNPLWGLENLVITPHISGGHHLPETFERIVDIAAYNLSAYLNGRELKNIIDLSTGYKK